MSDFVEFDSVALLVDLPDAPLEFPDVDNEPLHVGDRGAIVFVHNDGAFCVEFFREGETVALADVTADQIRLVWRQGVPVAALAHTAN